MCYNKSSKMGWETKQHYSVKYKFSTSNLWRLEAFLLMHYEDLQQSSLIQGAWLLGTASTQPLHKSYSATFGNQLWWAAELRADGGELEERVI